VGSASGRLARGLWPRAREGETDGQQRGLRTASSLAATPPLIMVLSSHPIVAVAIVLAVNMSAFMIHTQISRTEQKCLWWPSHEWRQGKDVMWADEPAEHHAVKTVEEAVLNPVETAVDLIEKHLGQQWARCFSCLPNARALAHEQQSAAAKNASTGVVGITPTVVPEISGTERARVADGQTVISKQQNMGSGGLAVTRVKAPADLVWATLNDFANWHKMVDHCCGADVYHESEGVVDMKIRLGFAGRTCITAHVNQTVDPSAGRLTWALDATKPNDCVKHTGFWLVRPEAEAGAATSLVYYSADVELSAWAPWWINAFISEQGLPLAVGWLRRESERRAASVPRP